MGRVSLILLVKRQGDSWRLEEICRRGSLGYLFPYQFLVAGASPKGPFQIRWRGRSSNTWHHLFKENLTTIWTVITHPLFLCAFSRLQMSSLNLPSVIKILSSILSSIPVCFCRSFVGRAVCREEGSLRHLVSNTHHHRQLRLKEGLIHCSDENPFFSPLEERTSIPSWNLRYTLLPVVINILLTSSGRQQIILT